MEIVDHHTPNFKPKAWLISIAIYILFLLGLYLIKIVYEPKVEPLTMGVDLNYGVDLVGSGDIQTLNKANDSKNKFEAAPEESKVEKTTPLPPKPVVEKVKSEPTKTVTKVSPVLTSNDKTNVTIKSTTDKVVKTSPVVNNNAKSTTSKSTETSTPVKAAPAKVVDQGSLFKRPGSSGSNGTVGTTPGIGGNNNGDGKKGEVGDKGSPKGTLDGKSLYGNPGAGGKSSGASVSISGWKNRGPLNIAKDNSTETGKIRFKVVVDDFGDVVKIDVVESSLSPSVTNYYKNQITQKLKSNLIPEGNPPPRSTGTITINITRS